MTCPLAGPLQSLRPTRDQSFSPCLRSAAASSKRETAGDSQKSFRHIPSSLIRQCQLTFLSALLFQLRLKSNAADSASCRRLYGYRGNRFSSRFVFALFSFLFFLDFLIPFFLPSFPSKNFAPVDAFLVPLSHSVAVNNSTD